MSDTRLPQRPEQHVTGDRAVDIFRVKLNPAWVKNTIKSDYGLDVIVSIVEDGLVKVDFLVQIKGHEAPNYNTNRSFISEQISIETVNYFLNRSMPVMLCVCDTSNETLFYIWIDEDIKRIGSENADWSAQDSITFRLPTKNIIEHTQAVNSTISEYVKGFYRKSANEKEIVDVLSQSFGIGEDILCKSSKDESLRVIRPTLEKAGLIDDSVEDIKALSPEDQDMLRKVKEISTFLNKYLHDHAKQALDALSEQIKGVADSVKAKYHNNYGVYYSHTGDLEKALSEYTKASQASPDNHKAITNKVQMEYVLALKGIIKAKHDEWHQKLDAVIERQPDFYSAYRTKAYIIADTENGARAEEYLQGTTVWEAEPIESKVCLTDIYMREENMPEARRVLGDEQTTDSFAYWSHKGFVMFSLATGVTSKDKEYYLTGMGPSSIDYKLLQLSEKAYQKAYEILNRYGLPIFSDNIIVNYSTVLHLLFKHEVSLDICKSFLARHSDNQAVKGSIASCYLGLGKPDKAIPYAEEDFDINPNSTTLKNLCICLYVSEEYEECIRIIEKHIESDLATKEKGMLLSLLAISLNEIGNVADSQKVLRAMKEIEDYAGEAVSTEAVICRKNGLDREQALGIFRNGKNQHPDNIILLSNFAMALNPTITKEAQEIRECFETLTTLRGLFPDEYNIYSRALLTLGDAEPALKIIYRATLKFPDNMDLKYELAASLAEIGDEEAAYEALEQCFSQFKSNYSQIRNFATLAYRTGRFEQAIKLLQKALGKTTDPENKGEIHCILSELKKNAGYSEKDILRHVHEFGRAIKPDDEQLEARYLTMFMMATLEAKPDDETQEWFDAARVRLKAFSEKNPDNPYLKSFKFDPSVPEEEKGKELLATIMAQVLPHKMKADTVRMAARSMAYPLAFKSSHIGRGDLFAYWSHSIASKDDADYLHILNNQNNLPEENNIAEDASSVVIDISALLTLTQLELLSVLDEFHLVIISRGTKNIIEIELSGMSPPHELANQLEKWRLANKHRIRVRAVRTDYDEIVADSHELLDSEIYLRKSAEIDSIIGAGMGESVLLARQLNLPLYSDDSTMRHLASNEYQVKTFSSLSLLHRCVLNGSITQEGVSELYARLIKNHYFVIPFSAEHLTHALMNLLRTHKDEKLTSEDMVNDAALGIFLKQFCNTKITYAALLNIASEWWLNIMASKEISDAIVKECMKFPSFALSMHTSSTVMKGVVDDEKERRLAGIWFKLIVKAQMSNKDILPRVWSNMKEVTQNYYMSEEGKYNKVIYELIPSLLVKFLSKNTSLSNEEKIGIVTSITSILPNSSADSDRHRIEAYIRKLNPPFFK